MPGIGPPQNSHKFQPNANATKPITTDATPERIAILDVLSSLIVPHNNLVFYPARCSLTDKRLLNGPAHLIFGMADANGICIFREQLIYRLLLHR
jgi:hypothetical protein